MTPRILAVIVCLAATGAQAQSTVDIPIEQARVIAARAVAAGDFVLAREIARQLLEADPNDRTALVVMAATAPQLGDPKAGRLAGARAWRLSETDVQKYEAARLTALAAAREDRFTLANFWLRRSLTVAPSTAAYDRSVADARLISQRNPWSTQVGLSVEPSNNVNGGADDATLTAPGNFDGTLSEDALALAGVRASFDFATTYRFHADADSRATVGLQYKASRVRLDDDTAIPDETFDTNALELTLRYEQSLANGFVSVAVAAGRFDYRDLDTADFSTEVGRYDMLRFSMNHRMALSDVTELGITAQVAELDYLTDTISNVTRNGIGANIAHRLESGDRLYASLDYTKSLSDTPNYRSGIWTLQGGYNRDAPIGPLTLSAGAGVTWADYPDYRLLLPVTGGRQDTTLFYNVNVGFPDASYAGFTPGLSLTQSFAESNVSRFTRDTFSVGFTVSSDF